MRVVDIIVTVHHGVGMGLTIVFAWVTGVKRLSRRITVLVVPWCGVLHSRWTRSAHLWRGRRHVSRVRWTRGVISGWWKVRSVAAAV